MGDATPEFAAHFAALAAGKLCFPHCPECQRFHWYPMPRCPHCRGVSWQWREVSGRGTLFSWTEIHHAFDARYAGPLPYIVALVCFADAPGVRLITNLVGTRAEQLAIDMPVLADFSALRDGTGQLVFRVEDEAAP